MIALFLAASAPAGEPTGASTESTDPVTSAAALPDGSAIKVGLLTDANGSNGTSLDKLAREGLQKAAKENNLPAIGADVDQYDTYPELRSALISSTLKNVDMLVHHYLRSVADDSVKAGISIGTLQNGGVSFAPFHDWDSKIPTNLKVQIQKARDRIKDGLIVIDLP